jgi:hypothetical protein
MDLLENKTDKQLLESILAEIAKAKNEVACAKGDIAKAQSRLNFLIAVSNELLNRLKD